ncbi:MAG: ribonuclease P protein component [Paludibacteraceae bacterium]|nr:ribonuclease P protein component [Paludibacteraceae bacterium]
MRIKALYQEGRKLTVWPFRIHCRFPEQGTKAETKVLIWAPKSLFKHAVDRNRMRRLMREAYRLNKDEVEQRGWELSFNYMDKEQQSFPQIEKAMKRALKRLVEEEEKLWKN